MGITGARPELRKADGSLRDELVTIAPTVSVDPPEDLPAEVRVVWRQLATPMADAGLLDAVDAAGLEAVARNVVAWRNAYRIMDEEGEYVESPNGYKIAHPAMAVANKAQSEYRAWAARYGLTPLDRVSLGLAMVRGKNLEQELTTKIGPSPRKS